MALSPKVEESLDDALSSLRSALAYAARNERVTICEAISKVMGELENISRTDSLLDTLENIKSDGKDNLFGN